MIEIFLRLFLILPVTFLFMLLIQERKIQGKQEEEDSGTKLFSFSFD